MDSSIKTTAPILSTAGAVPVKNEKGIENINIFFVIQ